MLQSKQKSSNGCSNSLLKAVEPALRMGSIYLKDDFLHPLDIYLLSQLGRICNSLLTNLK